MDLNEHVTFRTVDGQSDGYASDIDSTESSFNELLRE